VDPYLIISSDTHAGLPVEQYRDYLDPQYREPFDDFLKAREEAGAARALSDEKFAKKWFAEQGQGVSGGWDITQRDKELDGDGVAGEVIFPDADAVTGVAGSPFGAGLASTGESDPELMMAGARSHNRWLAELCSHSPERRAGVAIVPILHDPQAAVEEIKWAADNGLRGGILITSSWKPYPAYHDRRYDPVWAACQDLGMPVQVHSGPADQSEYGGHLGIYVTEVRWWAARPLHFLLWSGVFERFPGMRFGIVESSAYWAADLLWLMDTRFRRDHSAKKLSKTLEGDLTMLPSEYFDRNCFIGATSTERRELARRYEIGVDNLLWGNDFPHPEGTWPNTRQWLRDSYHDIPVEETRRMLGLAAAELYGFDLDALAPLAARIGPTPEDLGQTDPAGSPRWNEAREVGRHWLTNQDPTPSVVA
jgi:predicted TIM-barrel fold metal-dependent hydrolase